MRRFLRPLDSFTRVPTSTSSQIIFPHNSQNWTVTKQILENFSIISTLGEFATLYQQAICNSGKRRYDITPVLSFFEDIISNQTQEEPPLMDIFHFIAQLALDIDSLFSHPYYLCLPRQDAIVELTQRQCACILAHAFFLTMPIQTEPDLNTNFFSFYYWFTNGENEKIRCLLHYFTRLYQLSKSNANWGIRKVIFQRKVGSTLNGNDWISCSESLIPVQIYPIGFIEDVRDSIHADFANKYIGGGVLRSGCVQEEILFLIRPECLVSMLFMPKMEHTEAILLSGCERFCRYSGYGHSFKFDGDFCDSAPELNGVLDTHIVALDAIKYSREGYEQYEPQYILRELNKSFVACSKWHFEQNAVEMDLDGNTDKNTYLVKPFTTGNWGCGVFNANYHLKSLIQWASASRNRRQMTYMTFCEEKLHYFPQLVEDLVQQNVTVGALCNGLMEYGQYEDVSQCSVFQFIAKKFNCREIPYF